MSPFKVGDFDAAWENYDRGISGGSPQLITEAKEPIKVEDARPNYRLKVGKVDMTRRMLSCEVSFNTSGESGMNFTVAHQLRKQGYERIRVSLWIGYGRKLIPFFRGKLEQPNDHPSGLYSTATAYGLGTQMGARHFGARVSYAGWDLRDAYWDLIARFGADPDRFHFDGEHSQPLAPDFSEFGLEHTLLEAEQAILEPMGFAPYDQTGGMRVVRKPPRYDAVTRQNMHGIWADQHYPRGGFEFMESGRNMYSKVIVFRRNEEFAGGGAATLGDGMTIDENGKPVPLSYYGSDAERLATKAWRASQSAASEYAVYAESEVTASGGAKVHRGRAHVVPDFAGSQEMAQKHADWLALGYSAGVGRYSFKCSPCDYALNEFFGVERIEEVRTPEGHGGFGQMDWTSLGALYSVLYGCQVESMNLTIAPQTFSMQMSGPAVERERTLVRAAGPLVKITLGIPHPEADPVTGEPPEPVPEPAPDPVWEAWGDTHVTFADLVAPFSEYD